MEQSLIELWRSTGALARGVVGVLGGMSVAAGAIAAGKWLHLRRAERESAAFLAAWQAGAAPDVAEAEAARYAASPVAALVATLLAQAGGVSPEMAGAVSPQTPTDVRRELHDRTVRRHVLATGAELRRGLGVLATVGSTAPFVGLFGTVGGIINAFHEIGATGRGGIATVSTGIAEALVTTAVGIMVAIPAVWLFNHLGQRIARLLALVECAGEELAIESLRTAGRRAAGGRTPAAPAGSGRVPAASAGAMEAVQGSDPMHGVAPWR